MNRYKSYISKNDADATSPRTRHWRGLVRADGQETRQTSASVADTSDLSGLYDLGDLAGPSDYAQLMESICFV